LRDFELKQLLRYVVGNSVSIMLWGVTPLAVALATFATYVLSGNQLDVASALTALALFDILRFPLFMLPQGMCDSMDCAAGFCISSRLTIFVAYHSDQ